ncbi:MAG: RIP metalloprotease RseP [Gammaproteobacteria bacterium]|nr:RIP metalloprotease RseP [Gammaproteobacteria bacterium]
MADFFNNLLFFIIALGVLVTFHEFGHFWVALKLGVKVQRFSVGFGKAFYTYKRKVGKYQDEVEFSLALIPLGGYVKMLDERVEEVSEEEKPRAFNNQSLLVRSAIVFAGPLANFLLAIALYWCVFVLGLSAIQPRIAAPAAHTLAAAAGFKAEDKVVSVNDEKIITMTGFRLAMMEAALSSETIDISVIDSNNAEQIRTLSIGDNKILKTEGDPIEKMGFRLWVPVIPPVVGKTVPDSVAEKAGVEAKDVIVAINSDRVSSWAETVKLISASPAKLITMVVLRDGEEKAIELTPASRKNAAGEDEGYIGIYLERPESIAEKLYTTEEYSALPAIGVAIEKTWSMSVLTLKVLGRMLIGDAALENISGPLTIAKFAGETASIGLVQFLSFLAVISVSLGVLNLLPVPVLDGGHLLYYLLEFIKGKPLSDRFQQYGQQVGMMLLLMLMSIAIFNDIQRIFS